VPSAWLLQAPAEWAIRPLATTTATRTARRGQRHRRVRLIGTW
jgi:hypothetical protein